MQWHNWDLNPSLLDSYLSSLLSALKYTLLKIRDTPFQPKSSNQLFYINLRTLIFTFQFQVSESTSQLHEGYNSTSSEGLPGLGLSELKSGKSQANWDKWVTLSPSFVSMETQIQGSHRKQKPLYQHIIATRTEERKHTPRKFQRGGTAKPNGNSDLKHLTVEP